MVPDPADVRVGADWCIHAVIIHSPLVGPTTVAPLAAALQALGWTTTVPDLRTANDSPEHYEQRAVAAADATDIVIGHSGAGPFMPAVAEAMNAALVFVDAVVPPPGPLHRSSTRLLQLLDALPVVDGLLPPWHEWWPADLMAELVPDESLQRLIMAEIPRVPRSFFDETMPLPSRWWTRPAGYLRLSPAYDEDRARAQLWGWPTSRLDGRHLDVCVHPELIAEHVSELARRLGQPVR
jgi:hypothetical protein